MAGKSKQRNFSRSGTRQSVPPAGMRKTLSPEQQHATDLLRRPLQDLEDILSNSNGDNSKQFTQWAIKAANDSYPDNRICRSAQAVPAFFFSKPQFSPHEPGKSDVDQRTASGAEEGAAASCASQGESKKGGKEVKGLDPRKRFVTNKMQESAQRGDTPHRILGRAFRILNTRLELEGNGRTMFIISQFEYMHLLSWIRKPPMSKKYFGQQFPKVFDDPEKYIDYKELEEVCKDRGEIDLMILHEEKGILLIQIKSIKMENEISEVEKKLKSAYVQLDRDVKILNLVMKKSQHWGQGKDKVTQVMAVPNLSQDDLDRLDVKSFVREEIVFLCKDHMMEEGPQCIEQPESEANIDGLQMFWTSLPDVSLSIECIKEIVGLYVGPLSAVFGPVDDKPCEKPWSFKQCVKHAALLFSSLILTDTQRAIVEKRTKGQRRVYISGPPGSGKTLCLMLKASSYIAESSQHHVVVLNMYPGAEGRAIGQKTFTTICQNVEDPDKKRVHQLDLDLHNDKFVDWVKSLLQKAAPEDWKSMLPRVLFIVDEVYIESFWKEILDAFREELVDNEKGELADCEVWCAGLFSIRPKGFIEHSLDFVLRCPPAVQQLLYHVDWDQKRKKTYRRDTEWLEVLSNGPVPLCIRHKFHEHSNGRVIDCAQCATQLSKVLKRDLTEKTPGKWPEKTPGKRPASSPPQSGSSTEMPTSRSELTVVILINIPRNMYHEDDEYIAITTDEYNKYMKEVENSPFVKALTEQKIRVDLKKKIGSHDVGKLDVSDSAVWATWLYNFQGLEADVVIYLPGDHTSDSQPRSQHRDIPAPGVKKSDPSCRTAESSTESAEAGSPPPDSSSAGGDGAQVCEGGGEATGSSQGPAEPGSVAHLMWGKDDIQRYSDWDMTNILIAASRSLSLVILMVP